MSILSEDEIADNASPTLANIRSRYEMPGINKR